MCPGATYAEPPEPLRDLADKLRAIHTNQCDYVGDRGNSREDGLKRFNEVFTSTVYETEHPLVSVHPVTGERTLLVGHFLQCLAGFGTSDSNRLIGISSSTRRRASRFTSRWSSRPAPKRRSWGGSPGDPSLASSASAWPRGPATSGRCACRRPPPICSTPARGGG